MEKINFENPIYCIVTGASRGIGRTIAIDMARRSKNQIVLVLIARSEKNLNETKNLALEANKSAKIHIVSTDLSKPDPKEYEKVLKTTLDLKGNFSAIIFHNAADIGKMDKQINLSDVKMWQDYYTFNLFSVTALNSVFVKHVKELTKKIFIINVSAVMGEKPYALFSMYGSAKAARNLYFKVLAVEEDYCRILSWYPGVVKSDMSDEVMQEFAKDSNNEIRQSIKIITAQESVDTMFKVLEDNKFQSGDIIDYYDVA